MSEVIKKLCPYRYRTPVAMPGKIKKIKTT